MVTPCSSSEEKWDWESTCLLFTGERKALANELHRGKTISSCFVIRYDPTNDSWTLLRAELSVARHWVTAMLVEKETFPECN
jgi:hypothetical protein